jgi:hypothetical protein
MAGWLLKRGQADRSDEPCVDLQHWPRHSIDAFCRTQYAVFVPYFVMNMRHLYFYSLDKEIVLPFTQCERLNSGAFGMVSKIQIHPGQLSFEDYKVRLFTTARPIFIWNIAEY